MLLSIKAKNSVFFIFFPYLTVLATHAFSNGENQTSDASPFRENYITFQLARNHAYSTSQAQFDSGDVTFFGGMRHNLDNKWLMGVNAGFKGLKRRSDNASISLLTAATESMYIFRLYHPTYALIGPKFLYMLPTEARKIPPTQNKDYDKEFGVALSASIVHHISRDIMLTFRIDRWRGINTQVFQGSEIAAGFDWALPQ